MQSLVVYSSKKLKHVVACGDKATVDGGQCRERRRKKEGRWTRTNDWHARTSRLYARGTRTEQMAGESKVRE